MRLRRLGLIVLAVPAMLAASANAQWVRRDHRWPPHGAWNWALSRELPQLYREFNGIDFGHAHLAETLLRTRDQARVEQARQEVLDFIFSSPPVPPDEGQVAPTFARLAWEVQAAADWAHTLHRSLYDLFASERVQDKEAVYRRLMADYLSKPEAITPHRLDHHGELWSFAESKSFRDTYPKFNSQIWAYHWLQAAVYDVQLSGDAVRRRERMPRVIEHYHGYLRQPPLEWQFMPMMAEGAPEFAARFPEAAAIFDNLHMLHDNVDDALARTDLFPTLPAKRKRLLELLAIYLHRHHASVDRYADYHAPAAGEHAGHGQPGMGERPPTARAVWQGTPATKPAEPKDASSHGHH